MGIQFSIDQYFMDWFFVFFRSIKHLSFDWEIFCTHKCQIHPKTLSTEHPCSYIAMKTHHLERLCKYCHSKQCITFLGKQLNIYHTFAGVWSPAKIDMQKVHLSGTLWWPSCSDYKKGKGSHLQPKRKRKFTHSSSIPTPKFSMSKFFLPTFKPVGSIYGIFAYIYHKNQPNVGKYRWVRHTWLLWESHSCGQIIPLSRRSPSTRPMNHKKRKWIHDPQDPWDACIYLPVY